jgi:hypothetical protein
MAKSGRAHHIPYHVQIASGCQRAQLAGGMLFYALVERPVWTSDDQRRNGKELSGYSPDLGSIDPYPRLETLLSKAVAAARGPSSRSAPGRGLISFLA